MARYRIGPVRIGGGRRASISVNAGPFGATFGGRRRRRSSGGGGSGYSGDSGYDGPSAAEIREMERQRREYERWYNSLTAAERREVDQREWESNSVYWAGSSLAWVGVLRIGLLGFVILTTFFVWLLYLWSLVHLVLYLFLFAISNLLYAKFFAPKLSPALSFFDSRTTTKFAIFWAFVVIGVSLFWIKMPEFDRWLSPEGESGMVAFISYAILGWVLLRRWALNNLAKESAETRLVYDRMLAEGVLDQASFNVVQEMLNIYALAEETYRNSRYLSVAAWSPEKLVRGGRPSALKLMNRAKAFGVTDDKTKTRRTKRKQVD